MAVYFIQTLFGKAILPLFLKTNFNIFDSPTFNSCIAGGIVNPLTFKSLPLALVNNSF